jgi:hypothetical protein
MKRRLTQIPLHTGKAPPWLFKRMTKLTGAVTMAKGTFAFVAENLALDGFPAV